MTECTGERWTLQYVVRFIRMERPESGLPLLTLHRNSFQMDEGLNVNGTSLRLLEENVKEYLCDLRVVFLKHRTEPPKGE